MPATPPAVQDLPLCHEINKLADAQCVSANLVESYAGSDVAHTPLPGGEHVGVAEVHQVHETPRVQKPMVKVACLTFNYHLKQLVEAAS